MADYNDLLKSIAVLDYVLNEPHLILINDGLVEEGDTRERAEFYGRDLCLAVGQHRLNKIKKIPICLKVGLPLQ